MRLRQARFSGNSRSQSTSYRANLSYQIPDERPMPTKKNRRAARDVSRAFNQRKLPAFFTPMVAQRADRLPEGDEWTYELKLDGSPYCAGL